MYQAIVSGDTPRSVRIGRLLGVLLVDALDAAMLDTPSTIDAANPLQPPPREVKEGTAYVHFTSGSTGVC